MTYRVYLRDAQQRVTSKTVSCDLTAALAAFTSLVNRTELDGQRMLAVLNRDGRPVAHHNFERHDPQNHWRGRIDQIDFGKAA